MSLTEDERSLKNKFTLNARPFILPQVCFLNPRPGEPPTQVFSPFGGILDSESLCVLGKRAPHGEGTGCSVPGQELVFLGLAQPCRGEARPGAFRKESTSGDLWDIRWQN